MPLPALAASLLIPAGAQAIGTALKAAPGALDKRNKKRREEIDDLLAGGGGLSPEERGTLERNMAPARERQTQLGAENARLLAALGQTSGADLSALRRDTSRAVGETERAMGETLGAAELQARRQLQAEDSQLAAAQQKKRTALINSILSGAANVAGTIGQAAGAPPGTFEASGAFGQPVKDKKKFTTTLAKLGLETDEITAIQQAEAKQPGIISSLVRQVKDGAPEGATSAEIRAEVVRQLRQKAYPNAEQYPVWGVPAPEEQAIDASTGVLGGLAGMAGLPVGGDTLRDLARNALLGA